MKYLVKVTYIAKENNPNFAGETHVYYYGKEEHSTENPSKYFIEEHGYSRKSDALRNFHFKYDNSELYWDKNVEIVEMA